MKQVIVYFLLFVGTMVQAQSTVRGTVLSNEDFAPLAGVTVVESGTSNGTLTDTNGEYEITIKDGATLIFSYLGYNEQSLSVSLGQYEVDVVLVAGLELGEVVVTALGLERKSKSLGYGVQKLDNREISEVPAVNFLDNLSGKLAGVTISQGATGVGSTSKISIRGEASFTNNNPLFVVDGVLINNKTVVNNTNDAAAGFQEIDFGNGAMDVNPHDIESISVLKGPSAAALYGTRASNGVIIINTKRGSEKDEIKVSFNTSNYFERPFQLPEFQNKYGQGNNGEFAFKDGLGGGINDNITYSYGPALDQGILVPQFDSPVTLPDGSVVRGGDVAVHGGAPITPTAFVSNPDNLKNFYKTGFTSINNLAISGGFERGHYRLSLTNLSSDSYIPGVNLDRKTLSGNMSFDVTDKLTVSTGINYMYTSSDNRPSNGYGSENINYSLVAWLGRQSNIDALKDYWQPGLDGAQQFSFNYTFFDNPYFILHENRNSFGRNRLFGNIKANYKLSDHMTFTVRSGMDNSSELRKMRRAFSTNRFKNGGYSENIIQYREINTDVLLNYHRKVGVIDFDLSVGANRMDQITSNQQIQTTSLAQPGVFRLSNAASPLQIFENGGEKRINSIYGLLKLGYKEILYLDVTGRNDWSSALATPTDKDNVSFFYPSTSLSYVLSNHIDLPSFISFAKIRGSYAQVGNDTDPYRTSGTFIASTPVNGQPTFTDGSLLPNRDLLPEQTSAIEVGGDFRLFDDKLMVDLSYYKATTENQIIALPIPISSGYTQRVINGGEVRNQGFEAIVGFRPIHSSKLQWHTFVNFSTNVATVGRLPDEAQTLTLAYSRVYDNPNQTVWYQVSEGDRIGDMWGTGYLKNDNGDFIIGDDGKYIVNNDLIKLGNYNPDFIVGMSNRITYGNFGFNFNIDWRHGGTLVSRTQALAGVGGQLLETEDRPAKGIIAQGVNSAGLTNTVPVSAEAFYRQFYDRNHEENNTYDASYVKLRELGVSYTLDKDAINNVLKTKLSMARISLIGRNLFALSDIPHFDPEQLAVQGQNFVSGVEDMSYPTARSIGFSLNLTF